jgi:polar amino acid transport system substrate-binding protein
MPPFLAALLIFLLPAVGSLPSVATAAETVELAIEDAWEPYANADGTGMSSDIVRAAYQAVGIEVKLRVRPYARVLIEVRNGNVAGGLNVAREPSTAPDFLWGQELLFQADPHYYHLTDRPLQAKSAVELQNGERVGVIRGYEYGEQFFRNDAISKEWVSRHDQNISKLLAGRVEAIIMFDKTANLLLAKNDLDKQIVPAFPCESSLIYVAFSLNHPRAAYFAGKLDEGLRIIKANGVHAAIAAKY